MFMFDEPFSCGISHPCKVPPSRCLPAKLWASKLKPRSEFDWRSVSSYPWLFIESRFVSHAIVRSQATATRTGAFEKRATILSSKRLQASLVTEDGPVIHCLGKGFVVLFARENSSTRCPAKRWCIHPLNLERLFVFTARGMQSSHVLTSMDLAGKEGSLHRMLWVA